MVDSTKKMIDWFDSFHFRCDSLQLSDWTVTELSAVNAKLLFCGSDFVTCNSVCSVKMKKEQKNQLEMAHKLNLESVLADSL